MKQVLSLLLCLSIIVPSMPIIVQRTQTGFPEGTPISEWFLQTKVVHPDSLGKKYDLSDYGIESNPHIVQTQKIQKIIDEAAANGSGVIYIPEAINKSRALYLTQGTHLYLSKGATLLGSENIMDFPLLMTRIEGEYCKYFGALINADGLDTFTISGKGTIDGNGTPYWKAFRLRREWNPQCTNKDEMRPRLLYIAHCRNVQVSYVTLQNSPFWTSHYYSFYKVKLVNLRFFSPIKHIK